MSYSFVSATFAMAAAGGRRGPERAEGRRGRDREHIDSLATELCRINEDQKVALDLDPYVKKLLNARRRVVLVNNILQNAQERLRRLNHSVAKETMRRRAMLEAAGGYPQGLPSK